MPVLFKLDIKMADPFESEKSDGALWGKSS